MAGPDPVPLGPRVRLVEVRVATDIAAGAPVRSAVAADGSTVALTGTRIDLVFDRYLDPRTVLRQAICLTSDQAVVDRYDACPGPLFLQPTYDPAGRVASYYLDEAQNPELAPDTLYKLTVHLADDLGEIGFKAFDDAPLAAKTELSFRTVATNPPGALPERPPAPSAADCDLLEEALRGQCSGCHGLPGAGGISLRNLDEALATGLGTARGRQLGGNADQPTEPGDQFGPGMPNIDPSFPGNSYLLYKVLAKTEVDAATLAPGETARVRAGLITGMPMAPDNSDDSLTEDEVLALSRWIAAGAACP